MKKYIFVDVAKDTYESVLSWSQEKFGYNAIWPDQLNGSEGPTWYIQNSFPKSVFGVTVETGTIAITFKNESDASIFALKWGDVLKLKDTQRK